MVHGENRIPYWIDRRLSGLAGTEYHAIISFGLPIEPEDSRYGEYRLMRNALLNVVCRTGFTTTSRKDTMENPANIAHKGIVRILEGERMQWSC